MKVSSFEFFVDNAAPGIVCCRPARSAPCPISEMQFGPLCCSRSAFAVRVCFLCEDRASLSHCCLGLVYCIVLFEQHVV